MTEAAAQMARRLWYVTGMLMVAALVRPRRQAEAVALPRARQPQLLWAPRVQNWPGVKARWSARAGMLGLVAVLVAAILSRVRYIVAFDGTYGSGDAHGILVRALFLREGNLTPSPQVALTSNIFDQPPLLPAALALLSRVPGVSLEIAPLILMPALTLVAVVVLYRLLARTLGMPMAVAASLVFAVFPRWSFDSTEPDKGPAVVSLFIFALAATEAGNRDRRFLLLGGFFLALAMMTHTTAYFFLPVLLSAHLAWNAGSIRSAFSKHAVAALALPALAVIAYFVLARQFAGPPLEDATGAAAGGVLPSFVQTYVDAMKNLVTGGFSESAWGVYFTGIRDQLGWPLFVCAVGGFVVAAYQMVIQRRWELAPYVLWAGLVTLAFAIQYPAASHASRYPGYVTPAYIVLACYFGLKLGGLAALWRSRLPRIAGACGLAAIAGYAGATYALAPDPGLRDLYASHAKAGSYIDERSLLDDGGVLYMGWPSITLSILEPRPDYEDRLFTFGFGLRHLESIDAEFLRSNNIHYYLHDHTGSDYYQSADAVLDTFARTILLEEVATFTGRPGSYTTLYRLRERTNVATDALPAMFAAARTSPSRNVDLANGGLCVRSDGALSDWSGNGIVSFEASRQGANGCGVAVTNSKEWGGVRQTVPFSVPGQPFTTIAALRPLASDPASDAVVSIFAGSLEIGEASTPLYPGLNYVVLEAFTPASGDSIRVVVSTGAGDDGDVAIDGVAITDGLLGSQPAR